MSTGLVSAYDADTNDDGKLNFIKFDENDILENNIILNSSTDGQLSTSAYFSTSDISIGTHTIYFSVQDDEGAWSEIVLDNITVTEAPLSIIDFEPINNSSISIGGSQEFYIKTNENCTIDWYLNNVLIQTNSNISSAYFTFNFSTINSIGSSGGSSSSSSESYFSYPISPTTYAIKAIASNQTETDQKEWICSVSKKVMHPEETWELNDGYALTVALIDIYGDKSLINLSKNGELVDQHIVPSDNYYYYNRTLDGNDQVIIKAFILEVFQGQVDSLIIVGSIEQYSDVGTLDTDPTKLLELEEVWNLGNGYSLKMVDIEEHGNYCLLFLDKNGITVDKRIQDEIDSYVYQRRNKSTNNTETILEIPNLTTFASISGDYVEFSNDYSLNSDVNTLDIIPFVLVQSGSFWDLNNEYSINIDEISPNKKALVTLEKEDLVVDRYIIYENSTYYYNRSNSINETIRQILTINSSKIMDGKYEDYVEFNLEYQVNSDVGTTALDDKKVVSSGEIFELTEGYNLNLISTDLDGDKAFINLTKNDQLVDEDILKIADHYYFNKSVNGTEQIIISFLLDDVFSGEINKVVIVKDIVQNSDVITEEINITNIVKDVVEIRSPVFSGDNLTDLIANDGNSVTFTDFAAFYYDIDDGVGSESITFTGTTDVIGEGDLVYTAELQSVGYEYAGWDDDGQTYDMIGFLAEEYVPIDQNPGILSKLILDSDEKYTLRTGQTLELGEGFAITPKQIDVDGNKVWLELSKDGNFIDDEVFNTVDNTEETAWEYDTTIGGEDDIVMFRVHINEVFQGQVDSLAIIEGIWLINDEVLEIDTGDTFDDLEVNSITTGPSGTITMDNADNEITLNDDSLISVSDGIGIQTADPASGTDALRFFFVKQITEPGTHEIRGTVAEPTAPGDVFTWDEANFAGFYYDIDDDIASESLTATVTVDNRTIAEEDLVYTAKLQSVGYEYAGWDDDGQKYDKIGFLASEYVPIDQDPGILSKLILDSDDKYTLRTGQTLELGEGFAITPKQIDVDGNKVWLELSKDGEFIDDEVFNTLDNTDETAWEYDTTIGGEEDIVMLRVHINEVFQDQVDSLAIIEGVWLISDEVTEIDTSDTFGNLEVSSITTGPSGTIIMDNVDNEISLNKDSTVEIAEGLNFRVADSENDDVRFYPFINYDVIIENEIPTANISSILPNIADVGDLVTFSGTGSDNDGSITAYLWTSDLDGQLSTSENFSTSGLSLGTHTIDFKVQDDDGEWSATDSATVTINELPNVAPIAEIISIDPTTATEDTEITFNGSGTDSDGTIIDYDWNSSIDGQLSTSENFSTSGLSLGTHTIDFKVQDDDGAWSATDSATVTINEKPNVAPTAEIISIDPSTATEDAEITFNGSGTDSDGTIIGYDWNSSIDGQLSTSENFSTSGLSLGTHTINFKVQDDDGVWSDADSVAVNIIDDLAPEVHISAYPLEYISIYNPVTINLNSTDTHLVSTELIIADSEGHEIINLTITNDDPTSATYEYVWNATDKDGLSVLGETYLLFVNSTDTSGNFASDSVNITVDNEKPIVTFKEIKGFTSSNNIVYANSTLLINVSASGTPGDVNSVEYALNSSIISYKKNMSAELIDGNWTAIFDLSCIHDDGQYILTANAIDSAMNVNSTVSDTLIVVDRTSPIFSSTASMYNETHGMVSVISSESIIGQPKVEVNSDVIEIAQNSGKWTGYFQLDTEQIFNVNVTGTDIAGNIGSGSSVIFIEKVEFINGIGLFNNSNIDTLITFNTTNDTIGNIIVTESSDPMANLTDDSVGLYFISVELDSNLKENISNAMIAIPTSSVTLPDGIAANDVSIRYYNETADLWEICPTSIETLDGEEYWITYVDHFSIYGVVVSDTIDPILDSMTPVSGTTFAQDTTSVNIRFNYSDQQSGINVSSIIFNFDDIEITDNSLEITSNYASYNATGLSSGSYTASVTVTDNAGNSVPFSTSFSITDVTVGADDDDSPSSGGGSSGSGSAASGEAFENIAFKAVKTENIIEGLKISYAFDDEQNAIGYINFSALRNYGRVSTMIEVLKGESTMVDEGAPGVVYSNLNIWVGRSGFATEDNIADPRIGFSVAKDWLTENGIDERLVTMYRHNDGKWNALKTTTIGEDTSYIYFEAETLGFSAFAIAADLDDANMPFKTVSEDEISGSGNNTEADIPESKSNNIPGCTMFTSIFILVFACLFRKRKN
ncbi:S-layer protein domain-containing protein [Methanococcoides alaskense]|uniref:S-layer protein (TIGR01567 family) n=1 Tax=Methanococcoides alaskense TaxID=325778 RepID=A0AA90U1G0_9EURY|nr:S-layer protein domain-containing protein [Methanococcoides alaskense]MDR6223499.1 S-layer protein (TIGR01567 family) [Methanococcoides alaskense]